MSKLERFLGKSKIYNIDGEDIEVYPILFSDIGTLLKLSDNDTEVRTKAIRELVASSLKKSFPDATDEEIQKFDLRHLGKYLNAIFEVSGLKIDEKKLEEMTANLTQTT